MRSPQLSTSYSRFALCRAVAYAARLMGEYSKVGRSFHMLARELGCGDDVHKEEEGRE